LNILQLHLVLKGGGKKGGYVGESREFHEKGKKKKGFNKGGGGRKVEVLGVLKSLVIRGTIIIYGGRKEIERGVRGKD